MRQFHCNRKWTTNKPFGRKNIYVFGANIDYIGLEDARRWTNRVRTPAGDNQLVLRERVCVLVQSMVGGTLPHMLITHYLTI